LYPSSSSEPSTLIHQQPVIKQKDAEDSGYASFLDLIDLLFVRRFLEHGFSLQKIRKALAEAESIVGGHHFAHRVYFTDGREIYLRVRNKEWENLLQLLSGGQWVISEVILHMAKQVDFDEKTGFAEKWYPAGRDGGVVLDPRVCFGAPTIAGKGVRTSNIYDLFVAESGDTKEVSDWMNLRTEEVEAAVQFERALAA
jgi:uncharacterized protein (DUF433 family)